MSGNIKEIQTTPASLATLQVAPKCRGVGSSSNLNVTPPSNTYASLTIPKPSTTSKKIDIQRPIGNAIPGLSQLYKRPRDGEFWFEDGNTTLVARDVEFRVYKGLLACRSPVLKHMLSPAASESQAQVMQNEYVCSVIHLTDSPEDLRHLLRMYMPTDNDGYVGERMVLPSLSHLTRPFTQLLARRPLLSHALRAHPHGS